MSDYIIVPKIPTDEMRFKMKDCALMSRNTLSDYSVTMGYAYKAAISAAPPHNLVAVDKGELEDLMTYAFYLGIPEPNIETIRTALAPFKETTNIEAPQVVNFEKLLADIWSWSRDIFGDGLRTKGIINHIKKELVEIEENCFDLEEWTDLILLSLDGFWRHAPKEMTKDEVVNLLFKNLEAKFKKNQSRQWPDWRTLPEDAAIEHNCDKEIKE